MAIAFSCCGARTGVDTIETFARVAGALSLLASFRMGRGGEWRRAREKFGRLATTGLRKPRRPNNEAPAPTPAPGPSRKRQLAWLDRAVTVLWIVSLLFIVGYATVKGELALADLDELDLLAVYSLAP
jgi:hypothetical protein